MVTVFRTPLFLLALFVALGCGSGETPAAEPGSDAATEAGPRGPAAQRRSPSPKLVEVTGESGLRAFVNVNGVPEKSYLPGTTGAGVALLDADLDGRLDVFLVNGSHWTGFPPGLGPSNRLFLGAGDGRSFTDATEGSGLESPDAWGQGVSVADVDGDGRPDLYVTNVGPNALYLAREDGTWRETAAEAGVASDRWSTGSTFLDHDRDGDLDLYVANYVDYEKTLAANDGRPPTTKWKGVEVVAGPLGLPPVPDQFFENLGDGTFVDRTAALGLAEIEASYGFQPIIADLDGDGWIDIFVPNDTGSNFLLLNQEGSGFRDAGLELGVGADVEGRHQASMGVVLEDLDLDGRLDLMVTNFADDLNTLYLRDSAGYFVDSTLRTGLRLDSVLGSLAWGTAAFDVELDGDLDLYVANGHVYAQDPELERLGQDWAQKDQLFLAGADGRFREAPEAVPSRLASSRGVAMGDLDDDGDLDLVVGNVDARPTVLLNESGRGGHWLTVRLQGRAPNLDAIGARVEVVVGDRRLVRTARSSDSFLSVHDPRLHFGLGPAETVDAIEVVWPDGRKVSYPGGGVDRRRVLQDESP